MTVGERTACMAGPDSLSSPAPFPGQTAWSVILGASSRTSPEWKQHFERMVLVYWRPVFWYLTRRWNCSREDAHDLTQEFFLRLYEKEYLQQASPERGRFRTFIKLQVRNLVADDLRRRSAQKRGGGQAPLPILPEAGQEPRWSGLTPEEEFDRQWAAELLSSVVRELEETLKAEGKETVFRAFYNCCAGHPIQSYRECAEALGIKEADVRNYVHRARQRLREILRRQARETVEHEGDAESEMNALLELLRVQGHAP